MPPFDGGGLAFGGGAGVAVLVGGGGVIGRGVVFVVRDGCVGTGVVCGASSGTTTATRRGARTVNVVLARTVLVAAESTSR